ncbi:MAG: murein transglycosylase domain-containing protein [Gammaproteobacteria bacterium]|nr:murein transglycosylase domain-containing protein [Gammaproteobacteria bacterium]
MCTRETLLHSLCILLLSGCSVTDVMQVAVSRDPSTAINSMARNRAESYTTNPLRLVNDLKQAQRHYEQLLSLLRGEVGKSWGQGEVITADNKRYVKYTQNYKSRAIVNFDTGTVLIETLDQAAPRQSLKSAIVTTLLTPDDPRAVDLYSDKGITLSGTPYLHGLLEDHEHKAIATPWRAERYADHLLDQGGERRALRTAQGEQQVLFVRLKMVNDFENRQARHYQKTVAQQAKKYGVSRSLIYAIIKTESAFNPFAVSAAPAYGLMQLVPATGGRDAYSYAKGHDHTPSKEYLFNAENNIELGTAYLSLLDRRYLVAISDPLSREYCTIAAYNGGAGNVFTLFAADRDEAARRINRLPPAEVYRKLHEQHSRDETRRYLVKVLDARRRFATL